MFIGAYRGSPERFTGTIQDKQRAAPLTGNTKFAFGSAETPEFDRVLKPLHACIALEEVPMRERDKRFAITVLLTGVDAALLHKYFRMIWHTWSMDPWSCGAFLLLLALLTASAAVLWVHVYCDLRQFQRERRDALSSRATSLPGELRRDSDV